MTSAAVTAPSLWQGDVLRVSGDVDLLSTPVVRGLLRQGLAAGRRDVVVDLSAVTFMDCAGLGVLLDARAGLGGNRRLRGLPWSLQRILERRGLPDAFTMHASGALGRDRLTGTPSSRPVRQAGRDSGSRGEGPDLWPAVPLPPGTSRCPRRGRGVGAPGSPRRTTSRGRIPPARLPLSRTAGRR